jgi:MoxR-like ATPase
LIIGAKVNALLDGRFNVSFEDIQAVATAALRHRLLLNFEGLAEGIPTDTIIRDVLRATQRQPA